MKNKKLNKKGFTLIELLAVIVILGVLTLVAIPAVTRYIDEAKKQTYIQNLKTNVDVVRNGVIAGTYNVDTNGVLIVNFDSIGTEKGTNKSPYGSWINDKSYVKVVRNSSGTYDYSIQAADSTGHYVGLTNANELEKNQVQNDFTVTSDSTTYAVGATKNYKGENWIVVEDHLTYVTLFLDHHTSTSSSGVIPSSVVNRINNTSEGHSYLPFDTSANCSSSEQSGCTNILSQSSIKNFLDGYLTELGISSSDLEMVDGYKIRFLNLNELNKLETVLEAIPNDHVDFWLMNPESGTNDSIYYYNYDSESTRTIETKKVYNKTSVRPVINVKRDKLS